MEDTKKNIFITWIVGGIIGVILVAGGLFIYDYVNGNKDDDSKIADKSDKVDDSKDNDQKDNKEKNQYTENSISKNGKDYNIILVEGKVNIEKVLGDDPDTHLNVNITGFKLDGTDSNIKISYIAHDSSCSSIPNFKTSITLNDKEIYKTIGEGCYLTLFEDIIVVDHKYVGMYIVMGEGDNYFYVFDKYGKQLFNQRVVDFNPDTLEYTDYDENDGFFISKYKLDMTTSSIKGKLITKTSSRYCNQMNDYGICN